MTDKIVLNNVVDSTDVSLINENFQKLEDALNLKVLYRDNPVGTDNSVATDVDFNGKRVYNLPDPTLNSEPVTKGYLLALSENTAQEVMDAHVADPDPHVQYLKESDATTSYEPKNANIQTHISNTSNPHNVTKAQVGLGSVDNTSDASKPISTATQTALDAKVDETNGNASNLLINDKMRFTPQTEPAHTEGQVWYDSTKKALSYHSDIAGSSLQLGFENWIRIRNTTGGTLTDGTVVKITGASGQTPTVTKAIAATDGAAEVIGVITSPSIANNGFGYVVTTGELSNYDTSAWAEGTLLYLSESVAGTFTTSIPAAPNHQVAVATVIYQHATQGKLFIRPVETSINSSHIADLAEAVDDRVAGLLVAGTNITLNYNDVANTLTIAASGGGAGEANTASNLGAGTGVFAQKSGVDLQFKSLVAGTNVTLSSDANTVTINSSGGGGGGLSAWQIKTTGYTAVNGDRIQADTSSASFTITLPATPSASHRVVVSDYAGTFGTNRLTIGRNGSNIMGLAEDMTISTNNVTVALDYIDASKGWKVTA